MTNRKTTRRALVLSLLSLLLCCSMLVGTTFAWFTDSVTSGKNTIVAGNLDIELEYWNGTAWTDVNGKSDILTNTLWEPGVTEVAYLKVANAGTLALKYQLGINIVSEKSGVNVDGETFKLSDYIQFGVIENVNGETAAYASREAAVAATANSQKISAGYGKASSMTAGEELYLALVVYMPTTVGNEANYKTSDDAANLYKNRPEIQLGINVFATQVEAELDSFGPDYDEDADLVKVTVTNEADLVAALAEAKNGDVIGIAGNVTWTTGAEHGSTPFVENASTYAVRPAENSLTYITLKGVTPDATFTAIGKGVGPVGIDNGTVIFKDLKIVDESVSYKESSWEFGYLEFRGNTVFENCDVVNAIMMEGDSAKFVDCSFNSHDDNQYAVWVSNGTATFENCTFAGARGLKTHEAYGSEVGSVSVNNSSFVELSKKPGLAIGTVNADTAISLVGNSFIGTQPGDQGNYKYETDTDVSTFSFTDKDNTVAGTAADGLYKGEDGTYYATTIGGLNAGINAAVAGDTIVLSKDVAYTGNGYANITKDITLDLNGNNISTTTLGVVAKAGTIKNGTITNPVGSRAALRTWSGVSIENVTVVSPKNGGITVASGNTLPSIKNVTIEAQTYGIELQYGASVGTIENVTINAGKNGIVAQSATVGEIKNCTINGEECGVWAQLKGIYDLSLSFTDCAVSGKNYGIFVCDEGADIVPNGVAMIAYDKATTFEGGIKDKEFAFANLAKLYINGFVTIADGLAKNGKTYNVSNANGLATLNAMMADKSAGRDVVVELTADIDMTGKTWTPVDSHADSAFTFAGLNGNGHTISNLTVNGQAMFRRFAGSGDVVIKDVTFDGAKVDSTQNGTLTDNNTIINTSILTVQTYQNVTLDNVDVKNSTIMGGYKVAPLIATVYNESSSSITATLKNCDVSNTTVIATKYDFCTTGMVAFVNAGDNDKIEFENCTVTNVKLYAPNAYTAHAWVYTTGSETLFNEVEGVTVTNCTFENK